MLNNQKLLLITIIFLLLPIATAAVIDDSMHVQVQVLGANDNPLPGTYLFKFDISENDDCSAPIYTNSSVITTTSSRAIIEHELTNVNLPFDEQYYLCYYRNGTLKETSKITRNAYSFQTKNITAAGVKPGTFADGEYNFQNQVTITDTGGVAGNTLVLEQPGGLNTNFFSFTSGGIEQAYMDRRRIGMMRGTVTSPSYSFYHQPTNDYDTTTGMWSPGTYQIAFSTFGQERLRINSTGIYANTSYKTTDWSNVSITESQIRDFGTYVTGTPWTSMGYITSYWPINYLHFINNSGTLELNWTTINTTIDTRDDDTTYTHLSNFTDDISASIDTDTHVAAATNYLYNDSTHIYFNETKLNSTIDLRAASSTDTWWTINDNDLFNNSNILGLNWTTINATIDARDTQLSESEVEAMIFDSDNIGNIVTTGNMSMGSVNISGMWTSENSTHHIIHFG